MSDANLMDADCIHGETWWDCKTCDDELMALPDEYWDSLLADETAAARADVQWELSDEEDRELFDDYCDQPDPRRY